MKSRLFFLFLAVSFLFSCGGPKTREDLIKEHFEEYVQTDFDNPSDFIEVTKVECTDSFSLDKVSKLLSSVDADNELHVEEDRQKLQNMQQKKEQSHKNVYV